MLGASNVVMGIGPLLSAAQRGLGTPLDAWLACGHGRSYGLRSRVLVRGLPSIRDSGLWDRLSAAPVMPIWALVTDLGNDIGYGVQPEVLLGWVEECVERLLSCGAAITLVLPPVASVGALPVWRFRILRALLFPRSRLSLDTVWQRLAEVAEGARRLAAAHQLRCIEPPADWFGFDAIHLRRRRRREAWSELLAPGESTPGSEVSAVPLWQALRWQLLPPERRWWCGVECGRPAPQWRRESTRLYLF